MTSYSYVNGVMSVTTYVRDGWKRYHNMNAQYCNDTALADEMTVNGVRTFKRYRFISYNTPILYAMYDNKYNHWMIEINYNALHYSATTSRQLARFLSEFGLPISCATIRHMETIGIDHFSSEDEPKYFGTLTDVWFNTADNINNRF